MHLQDDNVALIVSKLSNVPNICQCGFALSPSGAGEQTSD